MSKFLNNLNGSTRTLEDGTRVFDLHYDLRYYSSILKRSVWVKAPFRSDGASVPKCIWWIYHPFGRYLEAAVVHDWFCVNHEIDSVMAADVFREAMEVCGVNIVRRNKMYWAVRMFGPKFEAKKS